MKRRGLPTFAPEYMERQVKLYDWRYKWLDEMRQPGYKPRCTSTGQSAALLNKYEWRMDECRALAGVSPKPPDNRDDMERVEAQFRNYADLDLPVPPSTAKAVAHNMRKPLKKANRKDPNREFAKELGLYVYFRCLIGGDTSKQAFKQAADFACGLPDCNLDERTFRRFLMEHPCAKF